MPIDFDLIQRINAFIVALDPFATEARTFGHDPVFGLESLNRKIAGDFVYHFGERASEIAVNVRLLSKVTGDVPNGIEVDVVNRRSTSSPDLVKLEGAVKRLLVGRSDLIAVAKVFAEEKEVIVGSARPAAVLTTSEVLDGLVGGAALSQLLEEKLEMPRVQEHVGG